MTALRIAWLSRIFDFSRYVVTCVDRSIAALICGRRTIRRGDFLGNKKRPAGWLGLIAFGVVPVHFLFSLFRLSGRPIKGLKHYIYYTKKMGVLSIPHFNVFIQTFMQLYSVRGLHLAHEALHEGAQCLLCGHHQAREGAL